MSEVLTNLSNDLAAAVEAAGTSIVRVEGRGRVAASGIVWSADGAILTAHHVLEQEENIRIGLADGRTVSRLFGRPRSDNRPCRAARQRRAVCRPLRGQSPTACGLGTSCWPSAGPAAL